MTSSLGKS
jgi:hypothetical protein